MKNYYEILEVNPKASDEIIKKIYKIKIKKNHPDLFQGEEKKKAEEITKELTEAYDILSDTQKRKDYDIELQNNIQEDSQYYKYQALISNLKEENEYLKNVIKSKNNVINEFIQTTTNTFQYKNDQDYHRYYRDQENYDNYDNYDNYENNKNTENTSSKNYFRYVLFDLKQLFSKLLVFFLIIISLLLILWGITGNNVFKTLF